MGATGSPRAGRAAITVAVLIVVAVLIAMVRRLQLGIDVTDEAYYVASALRFLRGDRPFVDEAQMHQTAHLLVAPVAQLSLWLEGGRIDGLVHFVRLAWLLFAGAVAAAGAWALRGRLPRHVAAIVPLCVVVFVPYNIISLGYNTLGSGLFALGIFLALRHLLAGGSITLVAAGLAHGLAAFAYPSLVLVLPWIALALALAAQRARVLALYAAGGALVIAAAIPLFLAAGIDQVLAVARASGDMVTDSGSRLLAYAVYPLRTYPLHGAALAGALLLGLGARARPRLALAGCALWPLLLCTGPPPWPGPPPEIVYSVHALMYLALPAPLLALGVADRRWAGTLLGVAWAPSLIAGLVFAWTSGNGVLQLGVGLAPAAVVTLALLAALGRQSAERAGWRRAGDWVALGVALPIVLGVVWLWRPAAIYRDEAPAALTVRMPDGAWRGIRTTPEHRRYLDELRADLRRFRQRDGRALFFYDFPAGFLLTNQRPLTSSSWTFRIPERRAALDLASIERLRTGRDTAVRILWAWWPNDQGQLDGERLDRWCQQNLRLRHTGRHWRIYTD